MAVELSTPSFKPREYEGEKIEYLVYGLDDEGNEIECIDGPVDASDSAAELAGDILKQFPSLYFHVTAVLNDANGKMKDSEVVWSNFPESESKKRESEDGYIVYSIDDDTGRVDKDGKYDTWRKAYNALADGTVWDKGSSNNFVYNAQSKHLQQIYKYKKTGRTGKWAGNSYEVVFDREISEDPANYIKNHFIATRYNDCRFNEGKKAEEIEFEKGHKNSRGEDAPWVIRGHKGGKILASFPSEDAAKAHLERMKNYAKTSKHEKLFNVKDLEEYAMKGYKAAVSAAWSAAGVKNFKIDFSDGSNKSLNVWPKTLDGNFYDVSWRIMPALERVVQYADDKNGNSTIEREIPFRTEDDIENIFTDEFKELDSVIEDGKPAKTETVPDDYARDNFLKGALDYAEIKDDNGNVVLLKIAKRYEGEPGGDFCLRSYDGETDKGLAMGGIRYVVGRYGELLDMEPAEAIIEIAKE